MCIVSLVLVLPPASSSARSTYEPVTVVDDSGVQTTFTAAPQRIVSLNPGHTETVFALGAGDRLVAVDTYSNYPTEAQQVQPRLTTYPTVSIETIVGLEPDLELALVEHDDVLDQVRERGIPVLKLFPKDFDAASQEVATLGRVLGAAATGETTAATMRSRRDAVVDAVASASRPTALYEMDALDPTKPFVAGPKGFYGQLVELAGATNIFADVRSDFAQVSAENVVARNPEMIILADAYQPYNPQTPAMVAARPGWDQIAAVQNGNIYAVQEELFASPSPSLADGLEALAYLIHPDRFAGSGGPHLARRSRADPYCAAGQTPTFNFGFQVLSQELGVEMGDPAECAHGEVETGDTYQQTTNGVAIYRRADNTPMFVSESGRWSLTVDGLLKQPAMR
jgi:iron complex transport system substrate-binding protein